MKNPKMKIKFFENYNLIFELKQKFKTLIYLMFPNFKLN